MKKFLASLMIIAVFSLSACSDGGTEAAPTTTVTVTATPTPTVDPQEQAEDLYLDTVRAQIPGLDAVPDDELIRIGEDICPDFETYGVTVPFVSAWMDGFVQGQGNFSRDDAAVVLLASTQAFCPDVYEDITELAEGVDGGSST